MPDPLTERVLREERCRVRKMVKDARSALQFFEPSPYEEDETGSCSLLEASTLASAVRKEEDDENYHADGDPDPGHSLLLLLAAPLILTRPQNTHPRQIVRIPCSTAHQPLTCTPIPQRLPAQPRMLTACI
jgi:hypothetical protein